MVVVMVWLLQEMVDMIVWAIVPNIVRIPSSAAMYL